MQYDFKSGYGVVHQLSLQVHQLSLQVHNTYRYKKTIPCIVDCKTITRYQVRIEVIWKIKGSYIWKSLQGKHLHVKSNNII